MLAHLNPGNALVCAFILSVIIACATTTHASLASLFFGILILPLSAQSPAIIARRLLAANVFILFLWLFVPFTTPGETLWQWGFLKATNAGINLALLVTIKANAIVCIFLSLVCSQPLTAISTALAALKFPEKLIWIFLLMGRNIAVLGNEWKTITEAAKLRAFHPSTNIRTYKIIAFMFAILLLKAHEKAEKSAEAMLLRGFSGKLPRFETLHFSLGDFIFCNLTILMALVILFLECGLSVRLL